MMSSKKGRQLRSQGPAEHGTSKKQKTATILATPAGVKSGRKPYSKEEDRAILEFLVKTMKQADHGIGGNVLYRDMADSMRQRTWQSLKERVKKRLKDHVEPLIECETVTLNLYDDGPASFRLVDDKVKLLSAGSAKVSSKVRRGPAAPTSDSEDSDSIQSSPTSLASDTSQAATAGPPAMEATTKEAELPPRPVKVQPDSKKMKDDDLLELVLKLQEEAPVEVGKKLVVAALLATTGNVDDTRHLLANGMPRDGTVLWSYEMDRQLNTGSKEDGEKIIDQFGEEAVQSRVEFLA